MKTYPLAVLLAAFHTFASVSGYAEDPSPFETLAHATVCIESSNAEAVGDAFRKAERLFSSTPPQSWTQLARREKLIFCLRMLDVAQVANSRLGVGGTKGATFSVGVEGVPIAGMDPKQIADPEVRKRYEGAIAENAKKFATLGSKALFQRLEQIWTGHVQHVVTIHYGHTTEELSEVNRLLTDFVSDPAARSVLRDALNLPAM